MRPAVLPPALAQGLVPVLPTVVIIIAGIVARGFDRDLGRSILLGAIIAFPLVGFGALAIAYAERAGITAAVGAALGSFALRIGGALAAILSDQLTGLGVASMISCLVASLAIEMVAWARQNR